MPFSKKTHVLILSLFLVAVLSGCGEYTVDVDLSPEQRQSFEDQISAGENTLEQEGVEISDRIEAYDSIGFAYQEMGNYKKALAAYEEALKLNSFNYVALNNSADIYEKVGEYEKAARFELVLYTQNKNSMEVTGDLIRTLCKSGQTKQALTVLEEYAGTYQSPENAQWISDQFTKIGSYN